MKMAVFCVASRNLENFTHVSEAHAGSIISRPRQAVLCTPSIPTRSTT
jgi:hypothetical protein